MPSSEEIRGFGGEVREALKARTDHLVAEGLARRSSQRAILQRDLLNTLRRRELEAVAAKLSAETGLSHPKAATGAPMAGTYRQRLVLASAWSMQGLWAARCLGMNERCYVIYVIADTGLRPSEVVNLNRKTIHLNAKIPYVSVLPDGRRLKTDDSLREIPLVGAALAAVKIVRFFDTIGYRFLTGSGRQVV